MNSEKSNLKRFLSFRKVAHTKEFENRIAACENNKDLAWSRCTGMKVGLSLKYSKMYYVHGELDCKGKI